jgi:hypothetical protein
MQYLLVQIHEHAYAPSPQDYRFQKHNGAPDFNCRGHSWQNTTVKMENERFEAH